jgi:hypothetical protein
MVNKKDFLNIADSYKLYKKNNSGTIGYLLYKDIINNFMKFLIDTLLEDGKILFPEKLGVLMIVGKKVKVKIENNTIVGLAPNWGETKKLWENNEEARINKKILYHFNEDTNSIRYRFFWSRKNVILKNKTLYDIVMTRTNKRRLSAYLKNGREYLIKN